MELFLLLVAIMPGLYLYSNLRKNGIENAVQESEYIVMIQGIIYTSIRKVPHMAK